MKENIVKTYLFYELSPEAKKHALDKYRYWNVGESWGTDWATELIEEETKNLEKTGFIKPKIYYSGFGSQGDGACFTCEGIDFSKLLQGGEEFLGVNLSEFSGNIKHFGQYYHAYSTTVQIDDNEELGEISDKILKKTTHIVRDKGKDIFKKLEKLYYELTSDEELTEYFGTNDYYQFLENGDMFTL